MREMKMQVEMVRAKMREEDEAIVEEREKGIKQIGFQL